MYLHRQQKSAISFTKIKSAKTVLYIPPEVKKAAQMVRPEAGGQVEVTKALDPHRPRRLQQLG